MSERLVHCQARGWIPCNGKTLPQLLPRNADIVPVSSPLLLLAKRSKWLRRHQLRDNEAIKKVVRAVGFQ